MGRSDISLQYLKSLSGAIFATVLIVGFLAIREARAAEVVAGSVYNEAQEAEVAQRARRRIYPGGRDEGELAVQPQMTTPTRKISPKAESPRDPSDD